MKTYHRIKNAWDAYWFLWEHPKFMAPERIPVETEEEALVLEKEGYWVVRDADGKIWRMVRHVQRRALDQNLEIFYAKTNKPGGHGRMVKDQSKNKHIECWLEFGPIYYGYAASGNDTPLGDWDHKTMLHDSHDTDLDCGDTTFDKALVTLAKKVLKKYGDYKERDYEGFCGKPICGDCERWKNSKLAQDLGLLSKN